MLAGMLSGASQTNTNCAWPVRNSIKFLTGIWRVCDCDWSHRSLPFYIWEIETWALAFSVRSSTAEVKVCMPPMAVSMRIPHLLRSSPSKLPGSRLNPALCNACTDRDRDPTSGQVLQIMHAGPTFSSPHPTVKIVFFAWGTASERTQELRKDEHASHYLFASHHCVLYAVVHVLLVLFGDVAVALEPFDIPRKPGGVVIAGEGLDGRDTAFALRNACFLVVWESETLVALHPKSSAPLYTTVAVLHAMATATCPTSLLARWLCGQSWADFRSRAGGPWHGLRLGTILGVCLRHPPRVSHYKTRRGHDQDNWPRPTRHHHSSLGLAVCIVAAWCSLCPPALSSLCEVTIWLVEQTDGEALHRH